MPNLNYLEVDPDNLFINYTIKEIQEINKKIQVEIEKKRQELRYMVGERYRDVLTTADTIQSMKSSAEILQNHIFQINQKCCDIQVSTQQEEIRITPKNRIKNSLRAVAIQIKILILVPEVIWTCLDNTDYLKAVQIYLLAVHIYTGLELDTEHKMLEKFPILSRLKLSVGLFRNRILESIKSSLKEVKLTPEEASQHLCAYILLDSQSQEAALKLLVELRHDALQKLLDSEVTLHSAVRTKILNIIQCLLSTVELLHCCFISADDHQLVAKQLQQALEYAGDSILHWLDLEETPLLCHVPQIIREFKPSCKEYMSQPQQIFLKDIIHDWLTNTSENLNLKLIKSLEHVTSVKVLYSIKEEALKIISSNQSDKNAALAFLPENFSVWSYFLQPLISQRAEQLVCRRVQMNMQALLEKVSIELKTSDSGSDTLRSYVWTEQQTHTEALAMQTRGFAPRIVALCELLDKTYLELLQDVCLYKYGKVKCHDKLNSTKESGLEFYLRQESSNSIQKLIFHVEKLISSGECCVMSAARLLEAISQMCPYLEKCCSTTIGSEHSWEQVLSKLNKHSLQFWELWLTDTKTQIQKLAQQHLIQDITYNSMLQILPKWDELEIEEQTEDKVITSKIRLPTQPSISLVTLLSAVLKKLDLSVPHTIPKVVHDRLVDILVEVILDQYATWMENSALNQNLAIQFLLDVKFVTLVCVRRDSKSLVIRSQEICDAFRSKIDPFDLDVFYPYLQNCIKRAVLQMQVVFGCLLGSNNQLANLGVLDQSSMMGSDREPTILSLSTSANDIWFPLLPVTTPATRVLTLGVASGVSQLTSNPVVPTPQPPPVRTVAPSHKETGSFVRSGAAALLADWFS